jgi:hypothetical protein
LNIIFYRLQTPTSGHSCLMTDIFWAAMEFYFLKIYIIIFTLPCFRLFWTAQLVYTQLLKGGRERIVGPAGPSFANCYRSFFFF